MEAYNKIRTAMRRKRSHLSPTQLQNTASRIAFLFSQHALFKKSQHIASFIAVNGEASPQIIHQLALQKRKQIYLPIVKSFDTKMQFGLQQSPRIQNKFNIPEPAYPNPLPLWCFNIVLVPLTAFDSQGNRIGMGGGYYDHTFAFTKHQSKRPLLIGVAHAFQKTAIIKPQPWDIPLDGILTEHEFTLF